MSAPQVEAQRGSATSPPNADVGNPPRKRRKRAPAAGAAADCFTCASRSVKCDRRRPYCTQCLDDGKDCAGYKTQLTWGNGVASRGKLRGLSLPIAGTQKLPPPTFSSATKRRPSQQQPPAHLPQLQSPIAPSEARTAPAPLVSPASATGSNHAFQYEQPRPPPLVTSPYPTNTAWVAPTTAATAQLEPRESTYPTPSSASITSPQHGPPLSAGLNRNSVFGGTDRLTPTPYTAPSPESAYFGRVLSHSTSNVSATLPAYPVSPQIHSPFDLVFPDHGQFPPYHRQDESYVRNEAYAHPRTPQQVEPAARHEVSQYADEEVEEVPRNSYEDECAIVEDDSVIGFPQLSLNGYNLSLTPFASTGSIGATPRMRFLINYYAEVISPVIVAFDGPSNPYRTQILRLATKSETLQHAIAALAASNLRQRRETGLSTCKTDPARRSSIAHLTLTHEPWHEAGLLSPQEQAREESLHKTVAIQSLNKQLANPVLRKDDSTLATLLILCLFHICDSGVAKFQTQFAGVKKLLSLRKDDPAFNTKEAKWFTRMFTWFDAMTATVNDREGQLQGYHLDVSALSDEEWALENLAGCDGQLFKTIAKLGRLNVLSQGKSVEETSTIVSRPPPPQVSLAPNIDYSKFDGNGWMRLIEDEDLFTTRSAAPDMKAHFWREWREIRQALMTWNLNTTVFDSSSPEAPYLSYEQRVDLNNISESFRYAALLYTERLANPSVPSTDPCIRNWVQECLKYINAVKSDVYLLWPLFITGSECVDDDDREVIRQRCLDIQKDSGFLNNKSCLELLEKVWRKYDDKERTSPRGRMANESNYHDNEETGFRFARVMKLENNEGEYIVV
ncbi:hypothetical protein G647_07293 [Cladophialophora carrionii CBS 160.54]|uniref:Zn(2)-C6 fungal-type domain-containing protein n=1 Tax=Cladophialophora carrionii CBS 160.54 TaxID=1279043 RepID=V9D255_9EURO|nr:uncharacterized protein G647_07293 [Cladophialophora carrionii CBS 160.54]ETI20950.1 hypothetical protein G647_07293 [Cladophialophora carrionii CBS 160.54]